MVPERHVEVCPTSFIVFVKMIIIIMKIGDDINIKYKNVHTIRYLKSYPRSPGLVHHLGWFVHWWTTRWQNQQQYIIKCTFKSLHRVAARHKDSETYFLNMSNSICLRIIGLLWSIMLAEEYSIRSKESAWSRGISEIFDNH